MVTGQNSIGQNGTDKMVRTKCYGQYGTHKMVRTKWYEQKWYGQNGTDKMVTIFIDFNSIELNLYLVPTRHK